VLTPAADARVPPPSATGAAQPPEPPWLAALLASGALAADTAERAQRLARDTHTRLGAVLTRLGLLGERELSEAMARHYGVEVLTGDRLRVDPGLPPDMNLDFCRAHRLLPLRGDDGAVRLAMADPGDLPAREGVAFAYGDRLPVVVALESDIDGAWRAHEDALATSGSDGEAVGGVVQGTLELQDDTALLADHASDAPVIRQAQRLIGKALALKASDIHVEPTQDAVQVRFRVDGLLGADEALPRQWAEPLVSRLKLMAKLDIAERRLPQDGRLRAAVQGQAVDLRVATFPSLHGESVVLRVLGRQDVALELDRIGLSDRGLRALRAALAAPNGLVLITGPTGSGKTTTLYAALAALRRGSNKLVTVEDPVEYTLPGVTQLQVKPEIGLDFPAALRSVLRNDPDVIMVGEIRDRETADIAVRAALTGHLVLATLHTNSAAGALTRLLDLGLPHYVLAATLVLTSAQRLVRRLCEHCRVPAPATDAELAVLREHGVLGPDAPRPALMQPRGCPRCLQRGFLGRSPVYEAMAIDESLRGLIVPGFDEQAFLLRARELGAETLLAHGLQKVLNGETTCDEILAVIGRLDESGPTP
jgi:general secretion pathway protein E